MGPMWPFLLMFESQVERHSFCGIETLNGCIPHVNGLSTDPWVRGTTQNFVKGKIINYKLINLLIKYN